MVYQQTSGVTTLGDMHLWIDGDDLFALHISDLNVTLGLNGKTSVTFTIPLSAENRSRYEGEDISPIWDRMTPTMWAVLEVPYVQTTDAGEQPTSMYFSLVLCRRPGEVYKGTTPEIHVQLDSAYTVMQDMTAGIGLQDADRVSVYQAIRSAVEEPSPTGWLHTPAFLATLGGSIVETLLSNRGVFDGARYTDDAFAAVQTGLPETLDQIMQSVTGRVASRMVTGPAIGDDGKPLPMQRLLSMFAEVDFADYVIGPATFPGPVPGIDKPPTSGYVTMVANQLDLSSRGATTLPSAVIPQRGTYTSLNPAKDATSSTSPKPEIAPMEFDDTLISDARMAGIEFGVGRPRITSILVGAQTTTQTSEESEITIAAGTKLADDIDMPASVIPAGTLIGHTQVAPVQVSGTVDEFSDVPRHVVIDGKLDDGTGQVHFGSTLSGNLNYIDGSGLRHDVTSTGAIDALPVSASADLTATPTGRASVVTSDTITGSATVKTPKSQGHPIYMEVTDTTRRSAAYDTPPSRRMKHQQMVQLRGLTFPDDPSTPEYQAGVALMRQVAQSMLYNQADTPSLTVTTPDPRFTAPGHQIHVGDSMPSSVISRNVSTTGTFVADTIDITVGDAGTLLYKISYTGYSGGNIPTLNLE